jgi:hypothetical protein
LEQFGAYELRAGHQNLQNENVFIGYNQLKDPPTYFALVSLPLRLFKNASFTAQGYLARLVSLGLYLLTIYAAWKAIGELAGDGHILQWMTALMLVFLPDFSKIMTSINNDVGAILAFTLFWWAAIRILKRGLSPLRIVALLLAGTLCVLIKNTAYLALPLTPLVLLFGGFRQRFRWLPWALCGAGIVAIGVATLGWGGARFWYQSGTQPQSTRVASTQAPVGNYVFALNPSQKRVITGQYLTAEQLSTLRGKTVTVGAWMWANSPLKASPPRLRFVVDAGKQIAYERGSQITLTAAPSFYSRTLTIPEDASRGWIELVSQKGTPGSESVVYYDGLVLALGEFQGQSPQFDSPLASNGVWNGNAFHNLIRNGSAESAQLRFNPGFKSIVGKIIPQDPDLALATLQDWQGASWYWRLAVSNLFNTFWTGFGWSSVGLLGSLPSRMLEGITLLGVIGAFLASWQKRRTLPWAVWFLLCLGIATVWGLALLRGIAGGLLSRSAVIPWARYAFPAILPTALLLCAGWLALLHLVKNALHFNEQTIKAIFIGFLLSVDVITLTSWGIYFYHAEGVEYALLLISLPINFAILFPWLRRIFQEKFSARHNLE